MDIDAPSTPAPPNDAFYPVQRPASAAPFLMRGMPRCATPFPRIVPARPMSQHPLPPAFAPIPRYPTPAIRADTPHQTPMPAYDLAQHAAYAAPNIVMPPYHDEPEAPPLDAAEPPEPAFDNIDDVIDITPEPNGGWREVQGKKPKWQFENLAEKMARAWEKRTFPRCLVSTAGQGACDAEEVERRDLQKETIMKVFGFTPRIFQAQAAVTKNKCNEDPPCNLVQAARWEDIQRLVDAKCLSVRGGVTLFFFPIEPPFPSFMALFSKPEAFAANGRQLIPTIRDRLFRPTYHDRFVEVFQREEQRAETAPTLSANERAGILIQSVTAKEVVRRWKGKNTPLVAIYCDIPTTDEDTWYEVRTLFRTASLGTDITGNPVLYTEPMKCRICRGTDHDTSMCYLQSLRNWYGQRGDSNAADDDADDDNHAYTHPYNEQRGKRGFRGRGRGGPSGRGHRGGYGGHK